MTTDTHPELVYGTYNLPQDPTYFVRDALVVHTYRDKSEPDATIYLGRNSGRTWDMSVYLVANSYLDAQLAARDLAYAVTAELPHLEHSVFSHTPSSKQEFEGQLHVDRDHYDPVHAVRRFHVNNVSDADLPRVAETILKGLGITGVSLFRANDSVANYANGVYDAENMSDARKPRAIIGNVARFVTGRGWTPLPTLPSQVDASGKANWRAISMIAHYGHR